MAGEIDRHRLVPRRQGAQLTTPVASVARPTVDEHQGRRPRAVHLERQGNAIPGRGDPAHRLTATAIMAPKHGPGTSPSPAPPTQPPRFRNVLLCLLLVASPGQRPLGDL